MANPFSNLLSAVTGGKSTPSDKPERQDRTSTGSSNEKEVGEWLSDKWEKIRTSYLTYHQLIWQSILFYVGQTWLTWDPYRKFYYPSVPEDEFTPQPRINRFSPAVDAIATNFNSIPAVEFIAVDADGDEQYKRHGIAMVATRLAKDFSKRQGLKSDFKSKGTKPTKAAMIYVLSGGCYTSLRVKQSTTQTPIGPLTQYIVDMDLLSPLVMLPRPGSEDFGGASGVPYTFVARRMTLNEAWTRFEIVAEADVLFLDGYNSTYENALNYYYTGFNATDLQNEDSCLVVELYIPPSTADFPGIEEFDPTGLYCVYCNGRVRWFKDWDYPEFPLTKADYISVPQMFFGRSVSFDLCNLQELLQQYEAIIQLHAMCNSVSPWVVDANTLVGEITGRADKVVKYRSLGPGAVPPKREPPGSLDQGVYAKLQQIKEEFENISGAASVFRGRQEGAITAGSAIAQLRGQAEQMFSGPQTNWNNLWKETDRKAVKFMQRYYTFEQIQTIIGGSNNEQAIRDFLECPDLDTCIEAVASAHGLPRTQDELKQEMLNLFDRGALDMQQVDVRERVFELFGETGMMSQFNLDASRARQENRGMKLTPPVPPTFMPEIEDLQVHFQVHVEEIKALEFDKLPPPNKQLMIQHALATKQAMQMLAAQAAMAAAPPPGGPPHPPQPPGSAPPTGTGHLASQGHPTGGTQHHGQGIQPIGASHGAPPAPTPPGQPHP